MQVPLTDNYGHLMKSKGQSLYEAKHPAMIRVQEGPFGPYFWINNPQHVVSWNLLTKKCQQSWDGTAKGHNFFSRSS